MFSKIFSLLSALLVVALTIMPFSKVQSQALVEFALVLYEGGLNTNEKAELYIRTNPASQNANKLYVGNLTFTPIEPGDSDCIQGILAPIDTSGRGPIVISHISAEGGNHKLVISSPGGEETTVNLKPCFKGRLVLEVGFPLPRARVDRIREQLALNPNTRIAGMPRIDSVAITSLEGETKAISNLGAHQLGIALQEFHDY